jgi:ABC-type dipeptide/oligopeptide/nickel transport system ATPase component
VSALLELRGLTVDFRGPRALRAVDAVDLDVAAGERLAIVGESGCGKSQLLLACTGLLAANGRAGGSARFEDRELIGEQGAAAAVRGRGIGLVFQDAGGSLTPHRRIGDQLAEVAVAALGHSRADARREAADALARVRLPDADARLAQYPHELSGGMRQRVAIALALMARPRLLFADEPTTALDVTVQAGILELLDALCRDSKMALLLVTHDLGVVAALADRIAVMRAGRIVESAAAADFLRGPEDPYSRKLLESVPTLEGIA